MLVQSYLFFEGRCEEALDFYTSALGATVEMMMRYKDNPEPPRAECTPPDSNKIMHASLRIGDTVLMASDGMMQGKPEFKGMTLALSVKDEAECDKAFNALADGGQVRQPLIKTFFSPRFGMVQDRFGVGWMVLVAQ